MKFIKNATLYDTAKSEALVGNEAEKLYRTDCGAYYIVRKTEEGGHAIKPLSIEAAIRWCEEGQADPDWMLEEFGDDIEEA